MTSSTGWPESSPMPLLLQLQMILRSRRAAKRRGLRGFEMKVTLEAVVGFVNRTQPAEKGGAMVKVPRRRRSLPRNARST